MLAPYIALGLPRTATDEEIRGRYLELVREHPPSRDPERFQLVAQAYEATSTLAARVETELFGAAAYRSFAEIITELEQTASLSAKPPGLRQLVDAEGR